MSVDSEQRWRRAAESILGGALTFAVELAIVVVLGLIALAIAAVVLAAA